MSWRIAESLKKLREQINEAYPGRDKASDGGIGDAGHASRTSDHNPWVKDARGQGVVTAIDIDEDLSASIHTLKGVIDAICASKDPRVKYIIYEGRITVGGTDLQMWKRYTGSNPHDHHAHISVMSTQGLYDNTKPWEINAVEILPVVASASNRVDYIVANGDTLWGLARKYATNVEELKRLNGLTSDVLQIGQRLRVR